MLKLKEETEVSGIEEMHATQVAASNGNTVERQRTQVRRIRCRASHCIVFRAPPSSIARCKAR